MEKSFRVAADHACAVQKKFEDAAKWAAKAAAKAAEYTAEAAQGCATWAIGSGIVFGPETMQAACIAGAVGNVIAHVIQDELPQAAAQCANWGRAGGVVGGGLGAAAGCAAGATSTINQFQSPDKQKPFNECIIWGGLAAPFKPWAVGCIEGILDYTF